MIAAAPDSSPSATTAKLPERLVRGLEAHASATAQAVAEYQKLAALTDDNGSRLLLNLVIANNRRLQALLLSMATGLHEEPRAVSVDGWLPSADAQPESDDAIVLIRSLMRDEREGGRYLRHLARQASSFQGGLYSLLLETLAREGETHWRILQFLLRRVELTKGLVP